MVTWICLTMLYNTFNFATHNGEDNDGNRRHFQGSGMLQQSGGQSIGSGVHVGETKIEVVRPIANGGLALQSYGSPTVQY